MRWAIIFAWFSCACAPVDHRPPFASAHYQAAIAKTAEAIQNRVERHGQFHAGWAKVAINIASHTPLAGYGQRKGLPSNGVSDPCYVRAFALATQNEKVLILTADLLALDDQLAEEVRRKLGDLLPEQRIIFSASHTHSGPGAFIPGLYELAYGDFRQESYDSIVKALVLAGEKAIHELKPARIGHAKAIAANLIVNRVEKNGQTDDLAYLLYFQQLESKRSAALWSFAAHPVTKTHRNLKLSADYPGEIAQSFEGTHLDQLGFVAGGVGSMNPRIEGGDTQWLTKPLTRTLKSLLLQAQTNSVSEGRMSFATVKLKVPPLKYRLSKDLMLQPWVARLLIPTPPFLIQALSINDSTILTLPVEISGQLTKELRLRSQSNLSIWSLNGAYLGYIVPRRVYELSPAHGEKLFEYETQTMSFLGPWGADYLLNIGMRLVHAVEDPR